MKLHQLVLLRNELSDLLNLKIINDAIDTNYAVISQTANLADEKYLQLIRSLASNLTSITDQVNETKTNFDNLIQEINDDIQTITSQFLTDNYQTENVYEDAATIEQLRQFHLPQGAEKLLLARINLYSSWKYPALEIGCRDGFWTKYLVGADPLYVTDDFQEFLDKTNSKFFPEYQARLRKYLIKDKKIDNLPINQFGFIFSFNYFNYLSLDSIKQFLLQAQNWLRPGGVMLFTYNNADLSASAGLAECFHMTYVPKSMLVPLIESLGFEIIDSIDILPSTSWIEIKRPGILATIKAHQVLGEIKFRDI